MPTELYLLAFITLVVGDTDVIKFKDIIFKPANTHGQSEVIIG